MTKIRITKVTDGWWTEGKIGEVFEVVEEIPYYVDEALFYPTEAYEVDTADGFMFVLKDDCEVVSEEVAEPDAVSPPDLSDKYPKYYKDVSAIDSVDVYKIHEIFEIDDPSGAIHHASKKLLLSGSRTGGKSKYDDVREARDTLTRWLDMQKEGD